MAESVSGQVAHTAEANPGFCCINGAHSQYFYLFWPRTKLPLNVIET